MYMLSFKQLLINLFYPTATATATATATTTTKLCYFTY